jgi:sterol 3beta-glucosyltransferase
MAVPFPQLVPTAAYPTIGFPRWKLGGGYNRATYRLVLAIGNRIGRKYLREWRSANDLPPLPPGTGILHRSDGSRITVLHGFSRHVVPEPPDWPDESVTTGYWFLDRAADWKPSPALEHFLASGAPPLSMSGSAACRAATRSG